MKASVLVVEDDSANRDALRRVLERAGFEVVLADNGRTALAEVGQQPFAAVVCDLKMPALSGMGVYAVLRELFPALAARMVFVTAFADDPKIREFLRGTGQPALEKPFKIADLVEVVRRIAAQPDGAATDPRPRTG